MDGVLEYQSFWTILGSMAHCVQGNKQQQEYVDFANMHDKTFRTCMDIETLLTD